MSRGQDGELRHGSLGLGQVLFQSITHMSPAVAVIIALGLSVSYAGAALPLSLLLALVVALLIANSVGQLAKQMPSAGGTYTYVSRGLGPRVGFAIGGTLLLTELLIPLAGALVVGQYVQPRVADLGLDLPWWVYTLAAIGLFFFLNLRGIELSTTVAVGLGIFEAAAILALSIWMIVQAGDANTLQVFNPANALDGGWAGVFKGMVFAILAFQGFEAAAPLGEEARDPRRLIPRAVVGSALVIGLLYVVCAYAVVMGWGFDAIGTYPDDPQPWITMARHFWHDAWIVVFVAFVNSLVAGGNAGVTYSTRLLYALGRVRVLPAALGRTHPRFRTPHVAVWFQIAVAAVGALVVGAIWGPANGNGIVFTVIAVLILPGYIALCVACTVFYVRERRSELNWLLHVALPVAGALALLAPLYYQFNPLPPDPIRWGDWLALGWVAIVVAATVWVSARRPAALEAARHVVIPDEPLFAPEPVDTPSVRA